MEAVAIGFGVAFGGGIAPSELKIFGAMVGSLLGGMCIAFVRYWSRNARSVDQAAVPTNLGWLGHLTYSILFGICLFVFFFALNAVIYEPEKRPEGLLALLFSVTITIACVFLWTKDLSSYAQDPGISLGYILFDIAALAMAFGLIALGRIEVGILCILIFATSAIIRFIKRKKAKRALRKSSPAQ